MRTQNQTCLLIGAENLSLEEIPVGRLLVEEGKNLPNSVTEDIGGFSLMSRYSAKQIRGMHRRKITHSQKETWTSKGKGRGWRLNQKW